MRSLNPTPVHRLVLSWACARLYVVAVVMSGVVEALTCIARYFPRKEHACSRVRRLRQLCYVERWLRASRRGHDGILRLPYCTGLVLLSNLGDKARKSRDLTDACSPITLPVTVGLGGSTAAALTALAPVPVTDGVERFYARGSPICSTLFP